MRSSYPEVSLLITHYNRSHSLEKLLSAMKGLGLFFGETIVSDDGSTPYHVDRLHTLARRYHIRIVTTEKNRGLGHNINKGQSAVDTPYVLYVQEDFRPTDAFPMAFNDAFDIMERDGQIDLINFYAYKRYPYTRLYGQGFSEKIFRPMPWYANHRKFNVYSDQPHLRRLNFPSRFGQYAEGVNSDRTERLMELSFIKNKGKALVYDDHSRLFVQENTVAEPSTANFRHEWRSRSHWAIKTMRFAYLKWKVLHQSWKLLFFKKAH